MIARATHTAPAQINSDGAVVASQTNIARDNDAVIWCSAAPGQMQLLLDRAEGQASAFVPNIDQRARGELLRLPAAPLAGPGEPPLWRDV